MVIDDRGGGCSRLPPRHLHLARRKTIRRLWPKLGDHPPKSLPQSLLFPAPRYSLSKAVHWLETFVSRHEGGERSGDFDAITPVVEEAGYEGGGSLRRRVVLTPKRRMSRMDAHLTRVTSY